MIALLDASFVRHLERAGALGIIGGLREKLGWEFVVPEAVHAELARRRVPPEVAAFLAGGTARVGRCGGPRGPRTERLLRKLGRGEAEAIRMVDECEDRTFKRYVILTDDRPAQARAGSLGMGSLDSVEFVLMANAKGLCAAGRAMSVLEELEAVYCVGEEVRADFVRRLV